MRSSLLTLKVFRRRSRRGPHLQGRAGRREAVAVSHAAGPLLVEDPGCLGGPHRGTGRAPSCAAGIKEGRGGGGGAGGAGGGDGEGGEWGGAPGGVSGFPGGGGSAPPHVSRPTPAAMYDLPVCRSRRVVPKRRSRPGAWLPSRGSLAALWWGDAPPAPRVPPRYAAR